MQAAGIKMHQDDHHGDADDKYDAGGNEKIQRRELRAGFCTSASSLPIFLTYPLTSRHINNIKWDQGTLSCLLSLIFSCAIKAPIWPALPWAGYHPNCDASRPPPISPTPTPTPTPTHTKHLPLSPHKPLLAVVTWQESDYGQGCNSS